MKEQTYPRWHLAQILFSEALAGELPELIEPALSGTEARPRKELGAREQHGVRVPIAGDDPAPIECSFNSNGAAPAERIDDKIAGLRPTLNQRSRDRSRHSADIRCELVKAGVSRSIVRPPNPTHRIESGPPRLPFRIG